MANQNHSARSVLLALGMGDFNATGCIATMFMAPAQTDPQMTQVIMITKYMQQTMAMMGATQPVTGTIDDDWAPYFAALTSAPWVQVSWFELARMLLDAKGRGMTFQANYDRVGGKPYTVSLSGLADFIPAVPSFLPDVPGGLITYAVGGYLLWRHLRKRKGSR